MSGKMSWCAFALALAMSGFANARVTSPPVRAHPDPVPFNLAFTPQAYAALGAVATSEAIVYMGTNTSPVSVTGGMYSVNGGEFTSAPGTVQFGDLITVRQTSAATPLTTTRATLSINFPFCDFGCTLEDIPFDVTTLGGHQVTHSSGTAVVAGVGVYSSGSPLGTATGCGAANPYLVSVLDGHGFAFSRPVAALAVPVAFTTASSSLSFVLNGFSNHTYPLKVSNFAGQLGATHCGLVRAVVSNSAIASGSAPANGVVTFAGRIRAIDITPGDTTLMAAFGLFITPWARSDLDRDGMSDLVWQNADGRVAAWTMQGLSVAQAAELIAAGSGWSVVAAGDFNGDAKADLVWQHEDGRVAIYYMGGVSYFSSGEVLGANQGWTVVGAADLDGSGKSKVVLQKDDGTVAALTTPDVTQPVQSPPSVTTLLPAGSGWSVVKIADFDGDNKDDLLWKHTDGRHAIWYMNGTSIASSGEIMETGGWTAIQVADLDGDGRLDIVFQHSDGSLAARRIVGNTVASGATLIGPGSGWTVSQVGDFNGDGKDDLLFTHSDGRVAIWLMDGLTPISQAQIMNAASGWSVSRVGDFDGDGKTDIVWQHSDGRVAIWLMNGTSIMNSAEILQAGTGWSVNAAVAR
ncbi:MAG TPA: VCBS repeat-containing protein [Usitatibacter sp.]|nr:VCBS repeat-containing protein [Usitatibacter sp.]